jgi:hypothetical protein
VGFWDDLGEQKQRGKKKMGSWWEFHTAFSFQHIFVMIEYLLTLLPSNLITERQK